MGKENSRVFLLICRKDGDRGAKLPRGDGRFQETRLGPQAGFRPGPAGWGVQKFAIYFLGVGNPAPKPCESPGVIVYYKAYIAILKTRHIT